MVAHRNVLDPTTTRGAASTRTGETRRIALHHSPSHKTVLIPQEGIAEPSRQISTS